MINTDNVLYLDKEFISLKYEEIEGVNPDTKISKSESMNALVRIPLFSGGASATESKIYSISTMKMLHKLSAHLSKYQEFEADNFSLGKHSRTCWIEGNLRIHTIKRTRYTSSITIFGPPPEKSEKKGPEVLGEESYYAIESKKYKFALVPTELYWTSGVAAFQDLIDNVIGPLDIPVRALLRIYAAKTSFEQWMAVPLIIQEY